MRNAHPVEGCEECEFFGTACPECIMYGETSVNKSDMIMDKAREMDWETALRLVNTAVDLHASRTAAHGQFSPEAVEKSAEIQAAWIRIQRG